MAKANFFLIGEARCGTTALYNMLSQHPDIYTSKNKEPRFFADDLLAEGKEFHKIVGGEVFLQSYFPVQKLKEYELLFADSREKAIGEGSVCYSLSKNAANEIYSYNPMAKIIFTIREPVSFLHSLYRHKYPTQEPEKNIRDALRAERTRKNWKNISKKIPYPSEIMYSERIKYAEHLSRFLKEFPKKQIFVIVYEEYKKDNLKTYRNLLRFLDLSDFRPETKRFNVSAQTRYPILKSIIKHPYVWSVPKKILSRASFNQIKESMIGLTKGRKRTFSRKQYLELRRKCRPEVKKIHYLLKRNNLSKIDLMEYWGYS